MPPYGLEGLKWGWRPRTLFPYSYRGAALMPKVPNLGGDPRGAGAFGRYFTYASTMQSGLVFDARRARVRIRPDFGDRPERHPELQYHVLLISSHLLAHTVPFHSPCPEIISRQNCITCEAVIITISPSV